jgi:hypothetical protein
MDKVIAGKDDFINRLLVNIEKGLATTTYLLTMDQIDEKLSELQKELMTLVRVNARTGLDTQVYSNEYLKFSAELDTYRDRRQKLKEQEAGRVLQLDRLKELKEYLRGTDTSVDKFDGGLFSKLVDKVIVRSLVEVTFVFKTGVEVKEILVS